MSKVKNILLGGIIGAFCLVLLGSILSGKSATFAADPKTTDNARSYAIGSTVVSTINMIMLIGIIIAYFVLRKKEIR